MSSLSSTAHYTNTPPPFSASIFAVVKHHHPSSSSSATPSIVSLKPSPEPPDKTPSSTSLRRPTSHKPPKTPTTSRSSKKLPQNPLKNLIISTSPPVPIAPTSTTQSPSLHTLTSKLRLSSKLSPPPPPSVPEEILPEKAELLEDFDNPSEENEKGQPRRELIERGKIFVGNLPLWIKKNEVAEFFRQFGPIKNVILIKGFDETEKNMGFGFVIYDGPTAEKAAIKAAEFDGVEFHGRVLTVKLDDGRRLKEKTEERRRWVEGKEEGQLHRTKWHEEREGSRREFRNVIETQPENWQAVVTAFEKIKKVERIFKYLGLLHLLTPVFRSFKI